VYIGIFVINLLGCIASTWYWWTNEAKRKEGAPTTNLVVPNDKIVVAPATNIPVPPPMRVQVIAAAMPGQMMVVMAGGQHFSVIVPNGCPMGSPFIFQVPVAVPAPVAVAAPLVDMLPAPRDSTIEGPSTAAGEMRNVLLVTCLVFPLWFMLLIHGSFLGACDARNLTVFSPFCITCMVFGTIILIGVILVRRYQIKDSGMNDLAATKILRSVVMGGWAGYFVLMIAFSANPRLFTHHPEVSTHLHTRSSFATDALPPDKFARLPPSH
jgi:hypothetical protein